MLGKGTNLRLCRYLEFCPIQRLYLNFLHLFVTFCPALKSLPYSTLLVSSLRKNSLQTYFAYLWRLQGCPEPILKCFDICFREVSVANMEATPTKLYCLYQLRQWQAIKDKPLQWSHQDFCNGAISPSSKMNNVSWFSFRTEVCAIGLL